MDFEPMSLPPRAKQEIYCKIFYTNRMLSDIHLLSGENLLFLINQVEQEILKMPNKNLNNQLI